ncbi:hypothetical protein N7465_002731 [Penicillium sp. CMV-2018d]|nr:hypothetical protein N7465_002731 [Penicillium sp. CMV-2018d]
MTSIPLHQAPSLQMQVQSLSISPSTVATFPRGARPFEANILNLVAECDGSETIRVPKVYRVFNIEPDEIYGYKCIILMDFIDGVSVEQCWGD